MLEATLPPARGWRDARRVTRQWPARPRSSAGCWVACLSLASLLQGAEVERDARRGEQFEKHVRPLLFERCFPCHGSAKQKGGLRLDSAAAARRGGDSGPAIQPGDPDASLLITAVRRIGDLKMPPETRLSDREVATLFEWVRDGAYWPETGGAVRAAEPGDSLADIKSIPPNDPSVIADLQIWLKADSLQLADTAPVPVWPDQSGHGRDFALTAGVRPDGTGEAPRFIRESTIQQRPAVRFSPASGLASSPDRPVAIRGDAEFTITLVMNLEPTDEPAVVGNGFDGVFGFGDPASGKGDPGRPWAALVQISRSRQHELQLAGGFNHDAGLGPESMRPFYRTPFLLTITKRPGPQRDATRFFLNGTSADQPPFNRAVEGRDTVPDIRHRQDIGAYLGRAAGWAGSIRGDLGEVIVFNRALSDDERRGIEFHLAEKYNLPLPELLRADRAPAFSAKERAHWAFQPLAPASTRPPMGPASSIDEFIEQPLALAGLSPSPPTDRRTLIRRATFDLTGLPPSPEEIAAFLADESPDPFARVIDRLLGSPRYGEHWGRHWLDVVRYAETTANDANAVMRFAYRYRDYVVESFNRDLPYDQFVVEQLAGDLLPRTGDGDQIARQVIATGFLMLGPKALAEADKEQTRIDIVDEQLDVTSRAILGLTLACARCHDHKFDPLPTTDYYALAGVFRSTDPLQDEKRTSTMFQEYPLVLPQRAPLMVMAVKEMPARDLRVHRRGNRFQLGSLVPRRLPLILTDGVPTPIETEQSGRLELARWLASPRNPLTARVMVNRIWQHHFGRGIVATSDNFGTRGTTPSHPELLDWLAGQFIADGWSVKAMHRRILLSSTYQQTATIDPRSEKLDPANQLWSRWSRRRLSAEEVRDGMLAVAERMSPKLGGGDSAEMLYRVAEVQDAKRGFAPNRMQSDDPSYDVPLRSLYLPVVRNALPDSLALFDAADPNAVTPERNDTTVPSQSLYLLNHAFVRDQARHFATSLLEESANDLARVSRATVRALGRPAAAGEAAEAVQFLDDFTRDARQAGKTPAEARLEAWRAFCQVLFCSNEFLYVD